MFKFEEVNEWKENGPKICDLKRLHDPKDDTTQ